MILQEWQFHLQAMLALMCFLGISNSITLFNKVFTESGIYRNISQTSGIGRTTYLYSRLPQLHMMARSEEKDVLIFSIRIDGSKCRSCSHPREHVAGMRYDYCLYILH